MGENAAAQSNSHLRKKKRFFSVVRANIRGVDLRGHRQKWTTDLRRPSADEGKLLRIPIEAEGQIL